MNILSGTSRRPLMLSLTHFSYRLDHVSFKFLVANPLSQKISFNNFISVVYSLGKLSFLLLGQLS